MQLARNIPKDNEQYIPGTITQKNTSKLYGQFCNSSQDKGETRRKDNLIFKDNGKA